MRKRRRPNYLSECKNVFSEERNEEDATSTDVNSQKKKPKFSVHTETENETEKLVENLDGQCCICEETLIDGTDIQDSTGSSDSSYADILNSTFSGHNQQNSVSQQFPRLRFSSGKICSFCKVPIQDIDLFQNKVIGLKKVLHNRVTVKLKESVVSQSRRGEKGVKQSLVLEEDKDKLKTEEESQIDMPKAKISTQDEENLAADEEVPDEAETRPKRKKLSTSMSEIEKAKIKNLKSDLKFQVKKRSKTGAYVIEYLKEKAGQKFLVKWENRHETENSWEPSSKIPSSVLKYYEEDLGRLGTPVPVFVAQLSRNTKERKVGDESQSESVGQSGKEKRKKSSVPEEVHLKSEAEGEYIEDATFDVMEADRTEEGNVRKSSRQPKLKVFHDSVVTSRSRPVGRSVSPAVRDKKSREKEMDEHTPRKSKRGPKPNKYYIPDESPKKSQSKEDAKKEEDNVYIIESLVDEKNGKYLVKWENYPSSYNTWEPRSSLPSFIVKFYEQDPSRLGMPAPDVS